MPSAGRVRSVASHRLRTMARRHILIQALVWVLLVALVVFAGFRFGWLPALIMVVVAIMARFIDRVW
jgi:hypothetical protein